MQQHRNLAARAGRWSASHRRIAVFGWLAFVVAALVIGSGLGTKYIAQEDLGVGESRTADQALADKGFFDRSNERVMVQAREPGLSADDAGFRVAVSDVIARVQRFDTVRNVQSPYAPGNSGQISRDGRSALIDFDLLGDEDVIEDRVQPVLDAVAEAQAVHPALRIEQFGDASANKAIGQAFEDDFAKAGALSVPITLIILVIAFGALVAAGLPLLLGLTAVAATLGLLGLTSQVFPVDESISAVILLIGLAVGVDYSLFYIRREREERAAGKASEAALAAAAATSGRSVLISGVTVMVAMAGMYVTGAATFQSFATGTILVVAVAMVGSVTVLPALLSKLGDNIDRGRVPLIGRLRRPPGSERGVWSAIVDRVLRHPWISVVLAGGLLVALAIPALGLHTINTGINGLPKGLAITQTYDRMQAAFPGGPLPAVVVVQADDVRSARVQAAIADMRREATATRLMQEPVTTTYSRDNTLAEVAIPVVGDGTDERSEAALAALRDDVIPQTVGAVPGVEAPVTGITAGSVDFNDLMSERAPLVFAFVLTLAFLLLMVTFRSVVIPLKSIVMNLLSVGAAYGVLVLIFQNGNLEGLLGFESLGGITAWLPLFLFVILFGLSMDYHVFILSRVREAFDHGQRTEEAVAHGLKATAGVVTTAATVMVFVFGIFATLSSIDFKMMGVGLAAAVFIDATIIRAVLLPATMKILGDWNWYLPRWLEWLPSLEPIDTATRLHIHRLHKEHLELTGELDMQTALDLRRCLREVEADEPDTLTLDLRRLSFMDSSGVGELVSAQRRAREAGRQVVLVKSPDTPLAQVLAAVDETEAQESRTSRT
jgi:anti-anti-sigma factor